MKLNNEMKIGVLVAGVFVALFALTWLAGDFRIAQKGYAIKVQFKNIDGVETNAPVTLNGFEVGRVTDIKILYGDNTRVELVLLLDATAQLHQGAKAYVKNMGFMGEKYVALTTGDDGTPFLQAGALIEGQDPGSFDKIVGEGESIAVNLKEISQNINERLKVNSENIDSILADLKVAMNNLSAISANVNERLEVNKLLVDDTVTHLNGASKNLEEMSLDLKLNPWKLLYKPKRGQTEIQ